MDSTLPTSRRRWHDHAAGPVSVPDPSHNQCRDHAGREIAHLSPGAVSLPEICPCCRNITPLGCRWKPPSPSLNHKRRRGGRGSGRGRVATWIAGSGLTPLVAVQDR
jgi:hypothetical protein